MSFKKNKIEEEEVPQSEEAKASQEIAERYKKAHGIPLSRREMLASGMIPFAATIAMPSWLKVFANAGVAQAEDLVCSTSAGGNLPAFVQIKLNGGAAMGYNSLAKYGGGTASNLPLINGFANGAQFYAGSGFYAGLVATAQPATLMKTAFAGVPCVIGDDSSTQKLGLLGAVNDSGLRGSLIQSIGTADTITGIPATPAG